jgi:serine/threonine protein kinase
MLPLTPTKLGRYEIVDEIGKGAMGIVYLARDPLIGRLVALKTFRIGYSLKDQEMEQFRARFMREAQSAGILTHPNIVTIHDVVEDSGDGLAFIAMEYVRGTNLKLLMQADQPLSPQFVLDIVSQVADALDYAHANRVVHRDIKPANILITAENRVKITDFGIARLDTSNLTQEGQLLGTPNYMAPEQIQGREVDHRADLFSLGVVLYEMFTRHKPFQGENLTVVSHRIVYDHFTPPRDYAGDLPPGVEAVLGRALEKDPARRYQRARDMVEELRRHLARNVVADDLNETRSILSSSPVVFVPPDPPAPLPPRAAKPSLLSRWRSRSAAPPPAPVSSGTDGSSASLPPPVPLTPPRPPADELTDTVATEAPPPAPRRTASVRRLATIGAALIAFAILAGAAYRLWQSWSQPAQAQVTDAPQPAQTPIAKLLEEGHAAMRRGEYGKGADLYRQAEQLDPANEDLKYLREMAEMQSLVFHDLVGQEKAIVDHLARAQQALAAGRYAQAGALASSVLALEPAHEEAQAVLAKAQQGKARQDRQRTASDQPGTGADEVASTAPATGEAQPAGSGEAAAKTSSLHVHFQSDLDATLIVRVNNQEVLRENLRRGGFFWQRRGSQGHNVTKTIPDLPADGSKLVVHVTPKGKGAQVKQFDLPGGGSHRLEIYLSKSAELRAYLI